MTRAREAARLIGNDVFRLDSNNAVGVSSATPDAKFDLNGGMRVTGIATISELEVTTNAIITGDLTVNGTTTTLDTIVQEVDLMNIQANASTPAIGVTQSGSGPIAVFYDSTAGVATFKDNGGLDVAGAVTATEFIGSGANLTDVISGIGITGGSSGGSFTTNLGVGLTAINFSGATVEHNAASGLSTITIASAGLSTESATPSNAVTVLDLSAQDHKITATGIVTITCSGGTEGDSHTVRITNSGIATVGFSTFFLFPSGATPSLPTTSGAISLISFTVNRVGAAGTQLLAGASVNFS